MKNYNKNGFSMVELLVAMAIASVIMIAIAAMFVRSSRVYTLENARAALQQEMRAVMEIMARDLRMALVNPEYVGGLTEIRKATATHLRFTMDLDGDKNIDPNINFPDCEVLSYRYSAGDQALQIICAEATTTSQTTRTLLGGTGSDIDVTGVNFVYRDKEGNEASLIQEIRGVEITLTAQIPAGSAGMESRSYTTYVGIRNAASVADLN